MTTDWKFTGLFLHFVARGISKMSVQGGTGDKDTVAWKLLNSFSDGLKCEVSDYLWMLKLMKAGQELRCTNDECYMQQLVSWMWCKMHFL